MASISSTWQTVDCAEPRHFMRMKLACYGWECDLKHHIRSFEFFFGGEGGLIKMPEEGT